MATPLRLSKHFWVFRGSSKLFSIRTFPSPLSHLQTTLCLMAPSASIIFLIVLSQKYFKLIQRSPLSFQTAQNLFQVSQCLVRITKRFVLIPGTFKLPKVFHSEPDQSRATRINLRKGCSFSALTKCAMEAKYRVRTVFVRVTIKSQISHAGLYFLRYNNTNYNDNCTRPAL